MPVSQEMLQCVIGHRILVLITTVITTANSKAVHHHANKLVSDF